MRTRESAECCSSWHIKTHTVHQSLAVNGHKLICGEPAVKLFRCRALWRESLPWRELASFYLCIRPWYTVACMSWCVNVFISCLRANHLMQKWDTVPVEISHSSRMPGLRPCSTSQTLVSRGMVSLAISYAWDCRSGHREEEVTKGIPAGFLHGFPVKMTSWCKFMGW